MTAGTDLHPDSRLEAAPAPRRRAAVGGAFISSLIAALAFAGAVTIDALVIYVMVAVVVGAGAALVVRGHWLLGALVGSGVGFAWAEVVNLLGGDGSGPIARSSFAAAVCTAFAVRLVTGPAPATFLVPIAAMLASAMILGASGEVAVVAVLAIIACTATLAIAEHRLRRWLLPASIWKPVLAMSIVLGAVGLLMAGTQAALKPGGGTSDRDASQPTIAPPWQPTASPTPPSSPSPTGTASVTPTPTSTRTPTPSVSPTSPPTPDTAEQSIVPVVISLLLLLLLALLVAYLIWRWRRSRRERQMRARLSTGSPQDRAIGAWVWALHILRKQDLQVPVSLSPDRFAEVTSMSGLTPELFEQMHHIAGAASSAAFSTVTTAADTADSAWRAVERLEAELSEGERTRRGAHA